MADHAPWGIHWFRRDLRVPDNPALLENVRRTAGRTLGLFCFDSKFLGRKDFSHNRFAFFLDTLADVRAEWRKLGGELLVVDCLPLEAFAKILLFADQAGLPRPEVVTFNRDYEPFARTRDRDVESFLHSEGVVVHTERDHLLFEPDEVLKPGSSDFYQVYSPFARRWFARLEDEPGQDRLKPLPKPKGVAFTWDDLQKAGCRDLPFPDAFDSFRETNRREVKIEIPVAGHAAALAEVARFAKRIDAYGTDRDVPAKLATSQLSWFMKNGSLTMAQIFRHLDLGTIKSRGAGGRQKFAQELVWREFFYSILYHRPDVETGPFNRKYADLEWTGTDADFERWTRGTTGFPIVDAGMRQLANEGWITNRVRIIVASFVIKDLLIDWHRGELHFMHLLIDGDTANNNGNWQWTASTGAEAQPFFRVLNPWLQSKRFDPDGDYIRRHVPELERASAKELHDPDADRTRYGYPKPMVDHSERRDRAIAMYKRPK